MLKQPEIERLVEQSAFVFVGTIQATKAANLPNVPSDLTITAKVETILIAPDILKNYGKQIVTIKFTKLPRLKPGERRVFFTNGWIFGQNLGVEAIGQDLATDNLLQVINRVEAAKSNVADKSLKSRLESADLSVLGKVARIEKSNLEPSFISEHDPDWHEATIEVASVEKGKKSTKEVKVLFPNSDDIRWHNIRKYSEGQEGIWLLQKGKDQPEEGISAKVLAAVPNDQVYTTLHPLDFLPTNDLIKVKDLLK